MSLRGRKLGILISAPPDRANFRHGLKLAESALNQGVLVYLYCIDDAVKGVKTDELQRLRERGLNLFACAYAAQRRGIAVSEAAAFGGLGVLSDVISATDRFVSFN